MSNDTERNSDRAFELIGEEGRIARTARMLDESQRLSENQRKDIVERFARFIEEYGYTKKAVAQELGISDTTISEVTRLEYKGKTADAHLVRVNNWMELAARRENIVRNRTFVETSVAREILNVAGIVAETCKMGVIFGPAQIGKTFTLQAIEGSLAFGDPVLIRVDESQLRPLPLCRAIASRFGLSQSGTFDNLFRRIVGRLKGTKRMVIFDECERVAYKSLEMIRDLHDETGCPVLLCGKPPIYEKLGFRRMGDYSEVTDQLAARIVIRRDLTLRTRTGSKPRPLFSIEDIRKLIAQAQLKLRVAPEAEKWLQMRASSLGVGGIGQALICLYLAYKAAFTDGAESITVEQLEDVTELVMGDEDAVRAAEVVAESSAKIRRIV